MDVANAASYGGFGRGGSAVLDPKTAVVDQELAKSDDFKAGLKGVAELKDVVTSIEAALVSRQILFCGYYLMMCKCRVKTLN